jgi:hypothetical protein
MRFYLRTHRWTWKLAIGLLCSLLLVIALAVVLRGDPSGSELVTDDNFDRLQAGMTVQEIEAIMGPAASIAVEPVFHQESRTYLGKRDSEYNRVQVIVVFRDDGRSEEILPTPKLYDPTTARKALDTMDWVLEKLGF